MNMSDNFELEKIKVAVIGLGYVGLPLAVELGKQVPVKGFDVSEVRILELIDCFDRTLEVDERDFAKASHLSFTANSDDISDCNFYIVTVPTPINSSNNPDLSYLEDASSMVGAYLETGDVVVYESTVYGLYGRNMCSDP